MVTFAPIHFATCTSSPSMKRENEPSLKQNVPSVEQDTPALLNSFVPEKATEQVLLENTEYVWVGVMCVHVSELSQDTRT